MGMVLYGSIMNYKITILKELDMEFTSEELEMIAFALEHLHDADLTDMATEHIAAIESAMDKLNIKYNSWL